MITLRRNLSGCAALVVVVRAVIAAVAGAMAAACLTALPAQAATPSVAEGQPQRQVLGGTWQYRPDDLNVGIDYDFASERSLRGWAPITVPFDFNAAEKVTNKSSVGWFRRDIVVNKPRPGVHRIVRFEGCGHFCTVYLNGRQLTRHAGSYLPFEADLGVVPDHVVHPGLLGG